MWKVSSANVVIDIDPVVKCGVLFWEGGGQFLSHREAYISNIICSLGLKTFQKLGLGGGERVSGWRWWWSKCILEFYFGPNLKLKTWACTQLNNRLAIVKPKT